MSRSPQNKVGWFRALFGYYRDPSASVAGKLVAILGLVYVILPVDLIPDVPVVGWLDDIGVMGLVMAWLGRTASRYRNLSSPVEQDPRVAHTQAR